MLCHKVEGWITKQCNVRNICVSYSCIEEIFPIIQEKTYIDKIRFIIYATNIHSLAILPSGVLVIWPVANVQEALTYSYPMGWH